MGNHTMGYFAVPYVIHFDDTMAYGSHHFLTNFKFQCAGREHLLFSPHFFEVPEFRRDFDRVLLLTHEGYSRNLSPANLGDRLVVFTSFEARGEVSLRFCFRTMKWDGTPVACGYQTVLCADRETGLLCPFPDSFRPCLDSLAGIFEPEGVISVRERALKGGAAVQDLFPESLRALARQLLADPASLGTSRIVEDSLAVASGAKAEPAWSLPAGARAFLFAGQGSFEPELFVRLKALQPELREELAAVEAVARRHGFDVSTLLAARNEAEVRRALEQSPRLDQLGIFLSGVLGARWLERQGQAPDVFVGHSFGEIAALTAAGALDLSAGAEVVCLRIQALREVPDELGTLAAIALSEAETARALSECGAEQLVVAGRNHAKQTVVAGPRAELERLRTHLEKRGQGFTFVVSRYPFHHRGLQPAAKVFRAALARIATKPPTKPVYSPIERRVYSGAPGELAEALAAHLLKPFDFLGTVELLARAGCTRFLDCGTAGRLARIVQRILPERKSLEVQAISELLPAEAPAVVPAEVKPEDSAIAIVSLGCMFPGGAKDPDAYWHNIREGISGIVDPGLAEPSLVTDFVGPTGTPDRAYTLLAGAVRNEDLVAPPGMEPARFQKYVREQKLLAIALAQGVAGLEKLVARAPGRVQCLLGSTAEGSAEYDAALSVEAGEALLRAKGVSGAEVALLSQATREVLGVEARSSELAPHPTLQAVVEDVVGRGVSSVLLDAACASSLYAMALGMKSLQLGEVDLVLAGGVFSPGPGNSCLFSQFNGLSATGSRPFDARADGVIFGEGAGVVGLMRLPDALAAGLRVRAIVRGTGLSSDGRSSSANVPRVEGQVAAMNTCYSESGIDSATIQYLEAHGTATPAGDATELKSIARVFGGKRQGIQLASVKALIGHVGWAAGAASVIKLCKALEHRLIPRQANFEKAGKELSALGTDFEVCVREQPWPENGEHPRRAATNGFGFGGTNAHLVLEEYRGGAVVGRSSKWADTLVVVAAEGVYPDALGVPRTSVPSQPGTRFDAGAYRPPSSVRLLPDITEDMDLTQGLALTAASALVQKLGNFEELRMGTAIVLGLEGKTRRGVEAIQRVLASSTRRKLRERVLRTPERAALLPLAERLHDTVVGSLRPSGPYTLQGMMANVTPGRVAGALDVKGPNFVVDAGAASLAASLKAARGVLASGFELALVGGAHVLRPGAVSDGASLSEGVMLLAVTTAATAAKRGLKVLCHLHLSETRGPRDSAGVELPAHSAREGLEVLRAVQAAAEGTATTLRFRPDAASGARLEVRLTPGESTPLAEAVSAPAPRHASAAEASTAVESPGRMHNEEGSRAADATGRVQSAPLAVPETARTVAEPSVAHAPGATAVVDPAHASDGFDHAAVIGYHAPVLVAQPARVTRPARLTGQRVLFIARDEVLAKELDEQARRLGATDYRVLFAGASSGAGRVLGIDTSSEERAEAGLQALGFEPSLILAVHRLEAASSEARVVEDTALRHEALELLFLAARRSYDGLLAGGIELASLCVGGVGLRRVLHPVTGLFSGMLKSLAREVPAKNIRAIATTWRPLGEALDLALTELGSEEEGGPSVEVCFDAAARYVRRLRPTPTPATGESRLDAGSVVLLTGGGRGVTAVLAGALLKRYGCTVVLLGRSDPESAPARVLQATDAQLSEVEREFYASELASKPGTKMPELRARFERHLAVRELRSTLEELSRLPGRMVYRVADVTRAEDVARVMDELVDEHGRLDLVVHGAGTQTSKKLNRRRLAELRTNLDTKLRGLQQLHSASTSRFGPSVPFHVLTSAFSFIGNDGQADYGAANEALDRLCAWVSDRRTGTPWCSVGWLAWDGIGMTRGSEYRVLGASRKLRGIRAEEGEALFLQLIEGQPREAINVQLTESERSYYGLTLLPTTAPASPAATKTVLKDLVVDAVQVPCLEDHLVRGTPTLPGAWALDLMLRAALGDGRPELRTVSIEDVRFSRFIRVKPGGRQDLRAECTPLADEPGLLSVRVRLVGDIVHGSGRVLERDVVHAEARFTLSAQAPRGAPALDAATPSGRGLSAEDPHCARGGPIELRKMFDCLEDIRLEPSARFAKLGLPSRTEDAGATVPALILDAALRLSAMHVNGVSDTVFAPIQFQRATFDRGLVSRPDAMPLRLSLKSLNPWIDGDILHCGTVAAVDDAGCLRMLLEGGVARPMA
ncbi:SDR family NAD(P)-dependent oxidoreductase [Myxococcus stipitatus]|uniref:SDR family NAD(P)-dependent oxidoreductase n=1 Tax=Myxococcus stipitatus TaxID=83455 RepID=UPI0031454301